MNFAHVAVILDTHEDIFYGLTKEWASKQTFSIDINFKEELRLRYCPNLEGQYCPGKQTECHKS